MAFLRRCEESCLSTWYQKQNRKPVVIRGARQVGKSTLVRSFAEGAGLTLAEVNLERQPELAQAFESKDTARILRELEATTRIDLNGNKTLLFLDEIQACPSALPALRYLYEERPALPVVAAGSLLEFLLADHRFSMPVGRIEYLHLGPMGFGDFVEALEEPFLLKLIRTWRVGEPIAEAAHRSLLDLQRQYLLVGGLPEAVREYSRSRSFTPVRDVHASIAATYQDDFSKYAQTPTSRLRLRTTFGRLPSLVGQKLKYSNVSREDRARDVRDAVDMLAQARVAWKVHHSDCSGVPLEAGVHSRVFKCLFLDIGLMNHMLGLSWAEIGRWDERQLVNEGSLAEQFVGQHLLFRHGCTTPPSLYYWLREGKTDNAEVDYVISSGRWIVPVEVKAGKAGSLRSLHQFVNSKLSRPPRLPVAVRFDLNSPSRHKLEHSLTSADAKAAYELLSLPLYMVEQLERLLRDLLD